MSRANIAVARSSFNDGLTIREHFAAQFLAAMLAHPTRSTDGIHECEIACQYADALIAELAKERKP